MDVGVDSRDAATDTEHAGSGKPCCRRAVDSCCSCKTGRQSCVAEVAAECT